MRRSHLAAFFLTAASLAGQKPAENDVPFKTILGAFGNSATLQWRTSVKSPLSLEPGAAIYTLVTGVIESTDKLNPAAGKKFDAMCVESPESSRFLFNVYRDSDGSLITSFKNVGNIHTVTEQDEAGVLDAKKIAAKESRHISVEAVESGEKVFGVSCRIEDRTVLAGTFGSQRPQEAEVLEKCKSVDEGTQLSPDQAGDITSTIHELCNSRPIGQYMRNEDSDNPSMLKVRPSDGSIALDEAPAALPGISIPTSDSDSSLDNTSVSSLMRSAKEAAASPARRHENITRFSPANIEELARRAAASLASQNTNLMEALNFLKERLHLKKPLNFDPNFTLK